MLVLESGAHVHLLFASWLSLTAWWLESSACRGLVLLLPAQGDLCWAQAPFSTADQGGRAVGTSPRPWGLE